MFGADLHDLVNKGFVREVNSQLCFNFLALLPDFHSWGSGLGAYPYACIQFGDFPLTSLFPDIVKSSLFDNC